MKDNTLLTICGLAFCILLFFGAIYFLSRPIETSFECNSGKIDLNLLINKTNFSYFEINGIDGLTCKGSAKFPIAFGGILK